MMQQKRTFIKGKKIYIPKDGIMRHYEDDSKKPFIADFSLQDAIAQYGAAKVSQQQAIVTQTAQDVQVQKAVEQSAQVAVAYSGTDAVASAAQAVKLAAIIPTVPSGAATEIASQVVRAAEAAQNAASLPTASEEEKTAAQVAQVVSTQALADAAKVQLTEAQNVQTEAEQTALSLKVKADANFSSNADLVAANQAASRLEIANNDLMEKQTNHDDAQQLASDTKRAADMSSKVVVDALNTDTSKAVIKLGFFDQIANYIYNLIYK